MKAGNTQRTSSWTIVLFISLIILVVMGLVSSALEIGERLGKVHIVEVEHPQMLPDHEKPC